MRYPQQKNSGIWNQNRIIFCTLSTILLFAGGGCTVSLFFSSINIKSVQSNLQSNYSFSTSIPWINNKHDCEHTARTWKNDKCWDAEHSLMF
ncbi:hypothetical protein [Calothrix sp. 336/3]|uniref:hypothetical protein n=1 Tax=Calothrix sp. 336/3 TaxID=1337936 RepID=UPI000624A0DF|nr:hypothetical protein [Calothrix sp. 336/3]AKG22436.1 hypothetical protein IJ00_15200 [Calothrix sp. 336/3]